MSEFENKYSIATASHLDPSTAYSVAWPIAEHVSIARRAGYQGVEAWPQRFGPTFEFKFDLLSANEKHGITSVHQSPVGVNRNKVQISRLQQSIVLPEMNSSLSVLEDIGKQAGDVPAVLFREAPASYMKESGYSFKQIQTDPETAEAWGILEPDAGDAAKEYVRKAKLNLFDGIVIDTHHIRRKNTLTGQDNPLGDWKKSIPQLLPYCREIHIGIGRTDYPDMAESAQEELDDLLNGGQKDSEVVQMLRFIADQGWKGLMVVEFRPTSIKEEYKRKLFIPPSDLVSTYGRIRETLFGIFEN